MSVMKQSPFEILAETLKTILTADATPAGDGSTLNGKVTPNNIRPFHDAAAPEPGGLIVFGLFGVEWDSKNRRGQADLNVNAEHPESGKVSEAILQRVRDLATAQTLTGNGCRVALFREQPQGTFDMASRLGGYTTKASFRVRLVAD